jgi:arylsulfatase A-like enzyme
VRVPTIVRWTGVTRSGSVCDVPITGTDYFPTLVELAGLKSDVGHVIDGVSFLPLLRGHTTLSRDAIYWHFPHYHSPIDSPYSAVRRGDWKLVHFFEDDRVELYNLRNDIGETKDLASANPRKAAELRAKLEAWRTSVGAQLPAPNPLYDESRRLEVLRWQPNSKIHRKY